MDVIEAIRTRREMVRFKDKPVPNEILENILEAGYLAPTGNNLPSRELILVKNKEILDTLEKTTPYMKWLKEASAAIVITGRPDISKYWIQDGSISSSFMWLRATELEVGVGFGAVYNYEDTQESAKREQWVRDALNIPEDRRILPFLGLDFLKKNLRLKNSLLEKKLFTMKNGVNPIEKDIQLIVNVLSAHFSPYIISSAQRSASSSFV